VSSASASAGASALSFLFFSFERFYILFHSYSLHSLGISFIHTHTLLRLLLRHLLLFLRLETRISKCSRAAIRQREGRGGGGGGVEEMEDVVSIYLWLRHVLDAYENEAR
jgi:hypothetical protein